MTVSVARNFTEVYFCVHIPHNKHSNYTDYKDIDLDRLAINTYQAPASIAVSSSPPKTGHSAHSCQWY